MNRFIQRFITNRYVLFLSLVITITSVFQPITNLKKMMNHTFLFTDLTINWSYVIFGLLVAFYLALAFHYIRRLQQENEQLKKERQHQSDRLDEQARCLDERATALDQKIEAVAHEMADYLTLVADVLEQRGYNLYLLATRILHYYTHPDRPFEDQPSKAKDYANLLATERPIIESIVRQRFPDKSSEEISRLLTLFYAPQ